MKGKKCIKLLTLCITFLLLLSPSLNANALKKQSIGYRYIGTLNWKYRQSGENAISQTASAFGNSLIRNISLNATANNVSYIYQPEIITTSNIPLRTDRLYHHTILFFSEVDRPETTMLSALCPRASNTFIDRCEIKELSRENYIQNITQIPDPAGVGQFNAVIGKNANNIQMVEIWGHGKSNQDLTSLTYQGDWLYFIQNTSSILDAPVNLTIYFSPIEIYTEEESAEDEAAKKELEDRDNLETQQGETESGAEDSSEDIGSATTNITGIVSTFLGNLQNLNANQCTLPEITAYGFSLGQLNLCTFQPPSWVQGISSAVVSLMMLGLAIHLFKRIMGIAKGLAGSK